MPLNCCCHPFCFCLCMTACSLCRLNIEVCFCKRESLVIFSHSMLTCVQMAVHYWTGNRLIMSEVCYGHFVLVIHIAGLLCQSVQWDLSYFIFICMCAGGLCVCVWVSEWVSAFVDECVCSLWRCLRERRKYFSTVFFVHYVVLDAPIEQLK